MIEIVTIANRKGGVAKTATASALGQGLMRKDYKVLFIDLDSQCNLTYQLGGTTSNTTIMEVLTGEVPAKEAIIRTSEGEFIPAGALLAGADQAITKIGKEYRLKEALEPLKDSYDYIIIDTPPALNILTVNALVTSNSVIIPAEANAHSLQGMTQLKEEIDAIKTYCNKDLFIKGVLLTRYNGRSILSRDMKENIEELAKQFDSKLFNATIRECVAIKEAYTFCKDIYSYAPNSNACIDYELFVDEFLKS